MTTWNYRVVRRLHGDVEEYDIREIYYDEAGKITGWTQEPIGPNGTSRHELMADVELMMEASFRPVLNYAHLPGQFVKLYNRGVLAEVLVHHWPTSTSGCGCGWAVLGASHPEHVADAYELAMLNRGHPEGESDSDGHLPDRTDRAAY